MPPLTTDAPAESSTAIFAGEPEDGFAEFQAENAKSVQDIPAENAPASEPEIPAADQAVTKQQDKTPLTDEQKSAAKRANNERRWAERERELSALRAENERLKASPAAKAESATAKPATVIDPNDPEPKEEDFAADPNGFRLYVKAINAWDYRQNDKTAQAERAAADQAKTQTEFAETFKGKVDTYAAAHEGFRGTVEEPGALEVVAEALDRDFPAVSDAIMAHDQAAELIDFLGTNPESLDKITAHRGNLAKALIELGRVIATEFDVPPVVDTPKPKKALPKPPAAVTTRGHAPTGEAAIDAAAEADDFEAFQKSYYGSKGQKIPQR